MPTITATTLLAISLLGWIVRVLAVLYALYALAVVVKYVRMHRASRKVGAPLSYGDLIRMRWRKIDPTEVIEAFDLSRQERLDLPLDEIERHHVHGGRVFHVIEAMALAQSRKMRTSWRDLCQRDLGGEDVVQHIQDRIDAVSK